MPEYSRQYVGARYVPKLFKNNNGTMEWQENTSYENFTMVSYNNTYYTSRKDVPPNIGNPATNNEFWCRMGSFNGGIENLQNQIKDVKDKINQNSSSINQLNNRLNKVFIGWNVLILGDNYATHKDNEITWAERMRNLIRNGGGNANINSSGIAGWETSKSYLDLYKEMERSGPFTHVFIAGGNNETSSIANDSISNFANYVNKNGVVKIYYLDVAVNKNEISVNKNRAKIYRGIFNSLALNNIMFDANSRYILNHQSQFKEDGVLITQNGNDSLAMHLINFLKGYSIHVQDVYDWYQVVNNRGVMELGNYIEINAIVPAHQKFFIAMLPNIVKALFPINSPTFYIIKRDNNTIYTSSPWEIEKETGKIYFYNTTNTDLDIDGIRSSLGYLKLEFELF